MLRNKIKKEYIINLNKLNNLLLTTFSDAVYEECLQLYHNKYLDLDIIFKEIENIYLSFFKSERTLSESEIIEILNKKDIFIKECKYILNLPAKAEHRNISSNNVPLFKEEINNLEKLHYLSKKKNFNDIHSQMSLNIESFKKRTVQTYARINTEIYIEYSKLTFYMISQVYFMLKTMNVKKCDDIDIEIESIVNSVESNDYKHELKKIFKSRDIERLLNKNDFKKIRQTGSHAIYKKGSKSIPVPMHSKDMKKGLSLAIQKQIYKEIKEEQ